MAEQRGNGIQTTLASPCGAGDVTIIVASVAAFVDWQGNPLTGTFRVTVCDAALSPSGQLVNVEIMEVTGVSGTTLTVTRGAEYYAGSNTALAHAAGSIVAVTDTGGAQAAFVPEGGDTSIVTVGTITAGTWHATPIANAYLANSIVTISGHSLSLGGTLNLAAGDVGLGSVTNDAQTKAAVVPNAAPSAGQALVGNAGGTAYAAVTISADATLSSAGVLTLATVNSNVGTFQGITVNAKGLVTAASNQSYLTGNQTITLSGNVTGSGTTAITTTIAAGAVTNAMLAGSIAASKLVGTDIATVGTITSGTWNGTALTAAYLPTLDAITAPAANLSLNSKRIVSLADPVGAQDAVTLNYLNLQLSETDNKQECLAATTAALAASTYNNGSSGVGATITLTVAAVLVLDGYTPVLNDRLLVKNQAAPVQNGIYYLSQVGVLGVTQAVLTRTLDFDQPTDGINGAMVYVLNGTANANTLWNCTTSGSITFGTTAINWTKFLGSTYTADETTLHLSSGTTFSIISTYIGQTSITTLGTVTTGVWNGTVLTVTYGGTGLATLTNHALQVGAGTSSPTQLGLGTTTTVLHGAASGDPTWGAVVLTTDVSGILPTANGGTGIAYFTAAGPTAARIYTFPDAACTILTTNAVVTVAQGGTGLGTLTAHALYVGNGTSAPNAVAVGATNKVLHGNTGADPTFSAVVEADLGLTDVTTANVSTTAHGFAPKAPNDATKYLDGTGAYSVPAGSVDNSLCNGRLTLTSGTPVTTSDVTGATNIYWSPYKGNRIALYNGSAWILDAFSEITQALGTLVAFQAYDVFAYDVSGTVTLEVDEWANAAVTVTSATPAVVTWTGHGMTTGQSVTFTAGTIPTGLTANVQYFITKIDANTFNLSDTLAHVAAGTLLATTGTGSTVVGHQPQARATALVLQDGVLCKTGALTRRYLGSFLTTATTTTEDSGSPAAGTAPKRYVWNYCNRIMRPLKWQDSAATWSYASTTIRQANVNTSAQVSILVGYAEDPVRLAYRMGMIASARAVTIGIGRSSTNALISGAVGGGLPVGAASQVVMLESSISDLGYNVGLNVYVPLESVSSTTTFENQSGQATPSANGLEGWVMG